MYLRNLRAVVILTLLAGSFAPSAQDKKKPDKKEQPRVTMSIPLGAAPGTKSKFTVRGLQLDKATDVRFDNPNVTARIVNKGKAGVPDKNPDKVGDTQIEVEIVFSKDLSGGPLPFTVMTPDGPAKHHLLIESTLPLISEKEPNGGFNQAQAFKLPAAIDGSIQTARDVDVFRFEGEAGQRLVFEVFAARHGSALDSVLTLYDAKGQQLGTNDDTKDSVDSRLEIVLPATGVYYLSLMDAHDSGGPTHVYRLTARIQKE